MKTEMTILQSLPVPSVAETGARPDNIGSRHLTRATTDVEAVASWLAKYQDGSRHTFDSYRREAERLLMWCAEQRQSLPELTVEDLVAYRAFLADPQPVDRWCQQTEPRRLPDGSPNPAWRSVQRIPRYLADKSPNPAWRPFVSALSSSAVNQAMTVLFGLFEHLAAIGWLASNPLRAARTRRAKPRKRTVERYLEQPTWQLVLQHLETWPRDTPRAEAHYQRTKFLVAFLYLTGLRRSELAAATTGDIRQTRGQWWLRVVGKGEVDAEVPLPADALAALHAYRVSTGRPPLPDPSRSEPLLMDIAGAGRPVSVKTIHQLLKDLFEGAATQASDPYQSEQLRRASAHWLRHTAATHQLEAGVPLLVVRDNLRHASVQTTELYLHVDRDRQAAETERHRLAPADSI